MRGIVGMFGGLCSAIVIVLVARYGYKTADNEIDGIVSALLFATIAAGGLGGFAVAIRVWQRNRGWAAGIGVIAAVALTVNLSNSLGAIAGRGDVRTAERSKLAQSVTDDRAELARITREREAVGPFLVTTVDATQIAREALLAAERMTKLECEKRTARCRDRESDEQARRGDLARVVGQRAVTERAEKLDFEIGALRERLEKARPVETVNPQATALARLFRLPSGEAANAGYYQSLAVALVVELLIAGSLGAFELMGPDAKGRAPAQANTSEQRKPPAARTVVRQTVAEKSDQRPFGLVREFGLARLVPAPGRSVSIDAMFRDYSGWCASQDKRALARAEFDERISEMARANNLAELRKGEQVFCGGVALAG